MSTRPTTSSGATALHVPAGSDQVRVTVGADDESKASLADEIVREEIDRLGQVFTAADGTSMLDRWIDDPSVATSAEFDRLLTTAVAWQHLSRGAFNVSMRRLHDLWNRAAADDCRPSTGELHELAVEIAEAPYGVVDSALRQLRDCRGLDLSSIVDGFIIDVATDVAIHRCHLGGLTVCVDDKVVHRGPLAVDVSIAALVELSGRSPTFTVRDAAVTVLDASQRSSRVLDPLTGHSVDDAVSVVVVAPDATTADVVGAVVRAMPPERARAFVDSLNSPRRTRHPSEFALRTSSGPIRCWILDVEGNVHDSGEE